MKIKILKQPFVRIINGLKKTGWFGKAVPNGVKTYEDILKYSSRGSSIDYKEARVGIEFLLDGAVEFLSDGYTVDLGPLGKFVPSIESKWAENPDDLHLADMHRKITYKPSEELQKAINSMILYWDHSKDSSTDGSDDEETPNFIDDQTQSQTTDSSTGTIDTSTGSNSGGGDDIPSGNG